MEEMKEIARWRNVPFCEKWIDGLIQNIEFTFALKWFDRASAAIKPGCGPHSSPHSVLGQLIQRLNFRAIG